MELDIARNGIYYCIFIQQIVCTITKKGTLKQNKPFLQKFLI